MNANVTVVLTVETSFEGRITLKTIFTDPLQKARDTLKYRNFRRNFSGSKIYKNSDMQVLPGILIIMVKTASWFVIDPDSAIPPVLETSD